MKNLLGVKFDPHFGDPDHFWGFLTPKWPKTGVGAPPWQNPLRWGGTSLVIWFWGERRKVGFFDPPPKNDQNRAKKGRFPTWPILLKNGHFWIRFWNRINKFMKLFFIRWYKKNFNTYRKKFSSFGKKISKVVINFLDAYVASYHCVKNQSVDFSNVALAWWRRSRSGMLDP